MKTQLIIRKTISVVAVILLLAGSLAYAGEAPQEDRSTRLLRNLLTLMGNTWADTAGFAGWLVIKIILWGIVLFILGALVGLLLYWRLRRRKLFSADFGWYRYVSWLWGVAFVMIAALGFGYAGLWLGGSGHVKNAIREDRVLDRVVINLCIAFMADSAEYEVTGSETAQEMYESIVKHEAFADKVLADSVEFSRTLVKLDADGALDEIKDAEDAVNREMLMNLAVPVAELSADQLKGMLTKHPPDTVLKVFILLAAGTEELDGYLEEHPEINPVASAATLYCDEVRDAACDMVNGLLIPNVALGAGIGLGAPLLLLALFRLAIRWHLRRQDKTPDAACDR